MGWETYSNLLLNIHTHFPHSLLFDKTLLGILLNPLKSHTSNIGLINNDQTAVSVTGKDTEVDLARRQDMACTADFEG
jgi:hypothetical protein